MGSVLAWICRVLAIGLSLTLAACATETPPPARSEFYRLPAPKTATGLKVALIHTGRQSSREGLVMAGGGLTTPVDINYIAVLIRHPKGELLFDTGLGRSIDVQYQAMPFWARPFLGYRQVNAASDQLLAAGAPLPAVIVLSHAHWDHASGLDDFPQARVLAPQAELDFIRTAAPPAVLPMQFAAAAARLEPLKFDARTFGVFEQSRDWFGDGSVVFVPLGGHTPGSTGLLIQLDSGQRYFFVGDAIWNARALATGASKPWFVRGIVDSEPGATLESLRRIRETQISNPGLVVVPAHDARVHNDLGFFPEKWLP